MLTVGISVGCGVTHRGLGPVPSATVSRAVSMQAARVTAARPINAIAGRVKPDSSATAAYPKINQSPSVGLCENTLRFVLR